MIFDEAVRIIKDRKQPDFMLIAAARKILSGNHRFSFEASIARDVLAEIRQRMWRAETIPVVSEPMSKDELRRFSRQFDLGGLEIFARGLKSIAMLVCLYGIGNFGPSVRSMTDLL